MLLTEQEARSKWCPLARSTGFLNTNQQGFGVAGYNRDHPSGMIPSCITTSCLAWRWAAQKQVRDIDLVTSDVVDLEPRRGYCGQFGRPEHED